MLGRVQKKGPPSSWRARMAALRNIPPLLGMVWATSPVLAFSSVLLRLTTAFIPLASLWLAKLIVDLVVLAASGKAADRSLIWQLVGLEILLAILTDVLNRSITLCDSLLGDRFTNDVSVRMMQHAGRLDLVSFEDPVFYDKMERARRQTGNRMGMLATLATICQQLLTLGSLSISVLFFSPWFLLLLIAVVAPVFLGETRFAMLSYSLLYRWTPERRELDYLRLLGASNASAKEVRIFGLADYLVGRARDLFERFYRENRQLASRRALTGSALNLLPTAVYYGAYTTILYRTLAGVLSLGDLTFLTAAVGRSRILIEQLLTSFSGIAEQAMFIEDLFDFFKTQPSIKSPLGALAAPRPIRHGFEFVGVSFVYPGTDYKVLDRINLRIDAGEKIALVGENGAGKTTLVKLIARLYDPTEGHILLDGADLRSYQVEDLRRETAVIFQDYMRYDTLSRENIGFGCIEELANQPRIEEAARNASADSVIRGLPHSYDQMLGRRFEGGIDLSAGQWQKIALARAYMRDAQLVILDEPTASLDARSEYETFRRFAEFTGGKTAILISHRFSTVRMADRIVVLGNGGVIEQGTHEQLLALRGRYSELFELQAAGYR